jgi:all-trans-8'-apo-beta-carotenal 15,15'-oxygenase
MTAFDTTATTADTATPATPATGPTALPAWMSVYRTPAEVNQPVTDVEGQVPEGLAGTLYRVGPAKLDLAHHLFDGDGMVSAVRFGQDGSVHWANRFVRTGKYLAELHASRPARRGFGTLAGGGRLRNALQLSPGKSNAANTSVMFTAGRLLALWEAGRPWQLDPATLETIGEMDFDGALDARLPFSAHPHWDPKTGEIFNFGMTYGRKDSVACYRIDRSGRLHHLARVAVPAPVMNHDFIVTDRWLVFCLNPLRMRLIPFLAGQVAFGDSLQFHEDEATTIILVPRAGGEPVRVEAPAWFQFHFAAAHDDGDDVVIDLARYQRYADIGPYLKAYRTNPSFGRAPTLWRYRVSARTRRVEGHELSPQGLEFPQVNGQLATGGYRLVYGVFVEPGQGFDGRIGRVDTETGQTDSWAPGEGMPVSEPIFVPRPDGTAEDDGWLVAHVYDPAREATDAVVLDARDLAAGPLCTAHLPVNAGLTFHGAWRRAA